MHIAQHAKLLTLTWTCRSLDLSEVAEQSTLSSWTRTDDHSLPDRQQL